MTKVRVGTRGSLLARTQTGMVVNSLREANPETEFELVIIKTTGDKDQNTSLAQFGFQGVFIKELEEALFSKEIDLAVHSLKDVPHAIPSMMQIASYIKREDVRDVLISKDNVKLEELPQGAVVGTGSPRRQLQLRKIRPDFVFKELRGNIDSRIKKVESGEYDAVILAAAGLHRISYQDRISHYIEIDQMVPAIAQGIIAIETRRGDSVSIEIARSIQDANALVEASAERTWMVRIGGGCKAPMAALAQVQGDQLQFEAVLGDLGSDKMISVKKTNSLHESHTWLEELALEMEQKAKSAGIPLPSELPDHALIDSNFKK